MELRKLKNLENLIKAYQLFSNAKSCMTSTVKNRSEIGQAFYIANNSCDEIKKALHFILSYDFTKEVYCEAAEEIVKSLEKIVKMLEEQIKKDSSNF